jgi:hypothetical protein
MDMIILFHKNQCVGIVDYIGKHQHTPILQIVLNVVVIW